MPSTSRAPFVVVKPSYEHAEGPVLVETPGDDTWTSLHFPKPSRSAFYERVLRQQQEQQHGGFDLNLGEGN